MALNFEDPYGGGTPDIALGQSKITPRETYTADPRAINERYHDNMKNANQLFEALSGFAGAVGAAGKKQQQDEVDQAGSIAAQVNDSIKAGENVDLKLGTLLPDHSPLARNAVAEVIGKQRGQADALSIYENMPLEARSDPAAAQAFFDKALKESATQYAASPFYNNARTAAMRQVFSGASASLSNQRNQKMVDILQQDSRDQFQQKADDIANQHKDNPAVFQPPAGDGQTSPRADRILSSPIGDKVTAAAKANGIAPNTLATIISIESGGKPDAKTGSYAGLGQLSASEWKKYGDPSKSIMDVDANLQATARSLADKSQQFFKEYGRMPSAPELYLMHQQGEAGLRSHLNNPDQPAYMSMLQTGEGKQKGEGWARQAIWGNISNSDKAKFGSVDKVTSKDFINYWAGKMGMQNDQQRVNVASSDGSVPLPDTKPAEGKVVRDYAGRPENLPPQVQKMRDELFSLDQIQNFTHPTVANAEKRDAMVDSVISTANKSGDKEWLKAIPNKILTPDLRDKLVKAEKQIETNNYTAQEHARKAVTEARTDAARDWNTQANAWIIQHPGEPPPPEMVLGAMNIGDPELLSGFNARRLSVIQGVTNPKVEDRNVQALEEKMIAIAAAGGDARHVDINSITDPGKHQKLLDFGGELVKTGGELSNEFYTKQWHSDAQSLYGFQFGVPLQGGQKSDPNQVATDHDFQKNLSARIAAYSAQHGAPINNLQRMSIYEEALEDTKRIHKATNDAGPRVSGGQAHPGDAEQDALKAAQQKYKLGKE